MNVLLIDDHPVVRKGLVDLLLGLDAGLSYREADSVDGTAQWSDTFDLVLLDMHLGVGPRATDALAVTRTRFPSAAIVVVSGDEDPALIRRCIELGASGFIPKKYPPDVCRSAVTLVLSGGVYLPSEVLAAPPQAQAAAAPAGAREASLTGRQLEVLRLAIRGKSNKVIAREMDISEGTVKQHLSAAYRTLGVGNRTEAVYRAAELGIRLQPDSSTVAP
jgi:DNA-binding NarL/FixJ family response regulator